MGREARIHSIRALEKRIEEGKGDITKLKRARNSLLNVSARVPPEILGEIFAWSLVRKGDFDGLRKGSYNFLLVCHHWFEVASRTPELWSFWGNTLRDWNKRHHHARAPLDLVLDGGRCGPDATFDESLRDVVRGHVMQDTIRQVHLTTSGDGPALAPIILSLTPDHDEGVQNDNIESIVWRNWGTPLVDVSNFFARSRLSNLRLLELSGNFRILSWDYLTPRTTLLTSLLLEVPLSPTPITSQLFSILASNPNIRKLWLTDPALPNDADGPTFQVPLHHLKSLSLIGAFHRVFGLLRQLVLPEGLDNIYLTVYKSTVEDISQTLGPYMRDYFQRNPRFQDRLHITSSSSPDSISFAVDVVCTHTTAPVQNPFVALTVCLDAPPLQDVLEQLFIDFAALVPQKHVVSLSTDLGDNLPEVLFSTMPNIEMLHLLNVKLSKGFLQPKLDGPRANTKLLPSLRSLCLEDVTLVDRDWSHLTRYLTHQTSDGQIISLEVIGYFPNMRPEVVNEIAELVEFTYRGGGESPYDWYYPIDEEDE